MKNVTFKVTGNTLTITVELEKRFGKSKSGKNEIIASTEGIVPVEQFPNVKVGLNVFT